MKSIVMSVLKVVVIVIAFVIGLGVGAAVSIYKIYNSTSTYVNNIEKEVELEVEVVITSDTDCTECKEWWEEYEIPNEVEEYNVYEELEYGYLDEKTNEIYALEINEDNKGGIVIDKQWCGIRFHFDDSEGWVRWIQLPNQEGEEGAQLFPLESLIRLACKNNRVCA